MISSIRPEQKWQAYSNGFIAKLYQAEAQKEANIDTMVAHFQQHVADVVNGVTANSTAGANQAAFGQDQLIRGVQTFRDPSTGGTMELSNQYDHAWLNGSNEYIMSDDPNFNPNGNLTGTGINYSWCNGNLERVSGVGQNTLSASHSSFVRAVSEWWLRFLESMGSRDSSGQKILQAAGLTCICDVCELVEWHPWAGRRGFISECKERADLWCAGRA